MKINPQLDLVLERTIDLTVEEVWKGWTTSDLICKWFCPEPWRVTECKIDLRPGGAFHTVMQSPEGEKFPNTGCILEVVPGKKFVWTDALLPEFRPVTLPESPAGILFTGFILLEPMGSKTKYTAIACHKDEADQKKHAEMGFHQGWGICADQLEKLMKSLR